MPFRTALPMMLNVPPAYTVPPSTASARTASLAFGFHAVARPVPASIAAPRVRANPPTLVNTPPAYTVAPSKASA